MARAHSGLQMVWTFIFFFLCFSATSQAGYWVGQDSCSGGIKYGESQGRKAAKMDHDCKFPNASGIKYCTAFVNCYSVKNNAVCAAHPSDKFPCGGTAILTCNTGETKIKRNGIVGCIKVDEQGAAGCDSEKKANPVAVDSGRKEQGFIDWASGGAFPLSLARNYSSQFKLISAPMRTLMGFGWRTNFDAYGVYEISAGATPSQASNSDLLHFVLPDAFEYHFKLVSGVWKQTLPRPHLTAPDQIYWDRYRTDYDVSIVVTVGGVELRIPNSSSYFFDNSGRLASIVFANGMAQTMSYDGEFLQRVDDSLGRSLQFEYESDSSLAPLVRRIKTSDGKLLEYNYIQPSTGKTMSATNLGPLDYFDWTLHKVILPDNTPATSADNPTQTYAYTFLDGWNGSIWYPLSNNYPLASITDEKGVVFASWTYDYKGRALTSYHVGATDNYSFAYDDTLLKTTVTDPLGRSTIYSYSKQQGLIWRLQNVDGVTTTNCAASNTVYLYDANGFRNQATDAEGRVMKWTRDTRGLPTTTVEGFGTAAAKTTTTTWDSVKPRPTQVVAPGLTSSFSYNPDGQIGQIAQTDTTSTTVPYSTAGQVRSTAFNYTALAQPSPPVVGPSSTALSDVNLTVTNPNATAGTTAGWTNSLGAIAVLTTGKCAASACFSGGTVARSIAYQDVSVPAGNTAEVDASKRALKLDWKQAANGVNDDRAAMRVLFLTAADAIIDSGPSANINVVPWQQRSLLVPIPAGTRKFRVMMMMDRAFGSTNDGYIDDIALKLVADGNAAALPFMRLLNANAEAVGTTNWTVTAGNIAKRTTNPCALYVCFSEIGNDADSMQQVVDIPTDRHLEIDNSARRIELSWLDYSEFEYSRNSVEVTFLNASSVALGDGFRKTVPQASIDKWNQRTAIFDIPVGARKIKFAMVFDSANEMIGSKSYMIGLTARLIGRAAAPPAFNFLTSVDGPLAGTGDKVFYAYDGKGNITSITNEVGHVTLVTALTSNGLPATIRDANLVDTTLTYNARDWLTSVTVNPGAGQAVTTLEYDAIGQITKITDPDGAYLQYVWSDARRLTLVTNNTGEKIEYAYNVNGDVTSTTVKSAANTITGQMSKVYDELGRLMQSIGAASQTTVLSYDRTDLATQVKDPDLAP